MFVSLLLMFLAFPHIATASAAEIWLRVGDMRSLEAPANAVVRVGSRGVLKAIDAGNQVKIVGLKPGTTSLVVGTKSYFVRVSLAEQKNFGLALKRLIGGLMGLRLVFDQNKIQVAGTLLRFSDWLTIAELSREHRGEYEFIAGALPDVAEEAVRHFQQLAQMQGFPVIRFSADPEFTVHIPQATSTLRVNVERIFRRFGVRAEVDPHDLALAPLVRTKVILAEVSKTFSRTLGVSWPSSYQANLLPRISGDQNLMVTLQAMESKGQGQILASPNLICRSGGEAKFLAGGEFPIRIVSRTTRDVVWKSHGVILQVKPKADFQGAISLEIQTEVSLLDSGNAVDGIPALKTNSVKSHFDLPGRRTIALSGLLRKELGESREGLPFLSGLPVLGSLFSSRNFRQQQTELVIFVTPEIYTPEADEAVQMPEGWVRDTI